MDVPEDDRLSLVSPVGYSTSTCGYCSPPGSGQRSKTKSSKSYGVWANNITPETYQQMLDRGWRRSGHYIYRPDCGYQGTCCPQVAIRVPVHAFRPRNDQKKAISALQRLVRQPEEGESSSSSLSAFPISIHSRRGKYSRTWDVEREWKAIEWSQGDDNQWNMDAAIETSEEGNADLLNRIHVARAEAARMERLKREGNRSVPTTLSPLRGPKRRRFETSLCLAESTSEKYRLFRSYQMKVHGEPETKVSSKEGFERFLCKAPLMPFVSHASSKEEGRGGIPNQAVDIESNRPIAYDLYHMEYRYQGRLVAVGVLDILPRSISSVYLFYDPEYAHLQLGKVSALREIALVKQIGRKKGMSGVQYYNLGLYIHSCQKMKYKAHYHPCELLDPLSCTWLPYKSIKKALDSGARYDFLQQATINHPLQEKKIDVTLPDAEESEEEEDSDESLPVPPPPGILDPTKLPTSMLAQCLLFDHGRVELLIRSKVIRQPLELQKVSECLAALGPLHNRFCLYL